MVIMDVDGVLTDGRIVLGSGGEELKFFHVQDGLATSLAQRGGLKLAIISARISKVTSRRAEELKIKDVYQIRDGKLRAYEEIKRKYNLQDEEIAYIGDDLHDLPLLKRVGLGVAVRNGRREVKKVAHYLTRNPGGKGAVREVIDLILKLQGKWEEVTRKYEE